MVKLIIGASSADREGWMVTDRHVLDALVPADWCRVIPRNETVDRILLEHVVEHWTEDDFRLFLHNARRFLSEQGLIRIAVPDGFHPDPGYIESVRPGGSGKGAGDHKVLYNHVTITEILQEEQYEVNLLEYFDKVGRFVRSSWQATDGPVTRCADGDPRNRQRPLSYTSLIADARRSGRGEP
jgi:predicted SAM-dependent methyltransferase